MTYWLIINIDVFSIPLNHIEYLLLEENCLNDEGYLSQSISVIYKSVNFPLGPRQAFSLHNKVFGRSVCNIFKAEMRKHSKLSQSSV